MVFLYYIIEKYINYYLIIEKYIHLLSNYSFNSYLPIFYLLKLKLSLFVF